MKDVSSAIRLPGTKDQLHHFTNCLTGKFTKLLNLLIQKMTEMIMSMTLNVSKILDHIMSDEYSAKCLVSIRDPVNGSYCARV